MPKLKKPVRPQWQTDVLTELATAQAADGRSYREICEKAGLVYTTFMLHKREPREMRLGEYHDFLNECER